MTAEKLSQMRNIGLHTAVHILKASTHKCILTTGMLSRHYKIDKSQLKYKLCGTFYVDYLKASVESLRGLVSEIVYTNKLGFKQIFYVLAMSHVF